MKNTFSILAILLAAFFSFTWSLPEAQAHRSHSSYHRHHHKHKIKRKIKRKIRHHRRYRHHHGYHYHHGRHQDYISIGLPSLHIGGHSSCHRSHHY